VNKVLLSLMVFTVFNTIYVFSACSPAGPKPLDRCISQAERKSLSPETVKFELRVAVDVCVEDRQHVAGSGDYATLDCKGDGGLYRVLFPRKEWLDMKRDGVGLTDPGPGK